MFNVLNSTQLQFSFGAKDKSYGASRREKRERAKSFPESVDEGALSPDEYLEQEGFPENDRV